jgi:hypothetical protein
MKKLYALETRYLVQKNGRTLMRALPLRISGVHRLLCEETNSAIIGWYWYCDRNLGHDNQHSNNRVVLVLRQEFRT